MSYIKVAKEEGIQATAKLIDAFHAQLAESRQSIPSVRCLSHSSLNRLALNARRSIDSTVLRECSGLQLIRLLEEAAVVRPVSLKSASAKKQVSLYSVGFNPAGSAIPAAELLQAHIPNGVLCYFSAIELHGLSTQPAPHYHIATRRVTPPQRTNSPPNKEPPYSDKPPPLGTLEFSSEGVAYYLTRRDQTNLLSIQRRQINPYCVVKVTTLEQTLLDCLHRPYSAGGAAIVFEAWEQGLTRTSPMKILTLATKMNDTTLLRRVGYMIALSAPQSNAIREAKQLIDSAPQEIIPPLLPGLPYRHINEEWGLRTP